MPDYAVPIATEYPNKKRILQPKSQKSKACLLSGPTFNSNSQNTITAPAVQAPSSVTIRKGKYPRKDMTPHLTTLQ